MTSLGFKRDMGGFVLRPDAFADGSDGPDGLDNGFLCGYPYDPHTFNFVCDPPGISSTCVPGCCCGYATMHAVSSLQLITHTRTYAYCVRGHGH